MSQIYVEEAMISYPLSKGQHLSRCIRIVYRYFFLYFKKIVGLLIPSLDPLTLNAHHQSKTDGWAFKTIHYPHSTTISSFMLWNIFNPFPETVVLDKTLESTLDSNQSILKEINPEYSLEGLMLKLQYFDHLMQRANSLKKILMLGKTGGRTIKRRQRMRWLDGIINWMDMSLSKLQEIVKDRKTWHATVYGVTKSRTLQSD